MPKTPRGRKGLHFPVKTLELLRRYAWEGERGRTLYGSLSLRPSQTVVDVGCGTGAFTQVLSLKLDSGRGGRIIGVDKDRRLLRAARRRAEKDGLDAGFISFQVGDARRLPFPDGYADRVVCQAVLWLMTEEDRELTLLEMIRVCKKGGIVGAIEGAVGTAMTYEPKRDRLVELQARHREAQLEGYRKLYGYDRNIGVKLPSIFRELGLERVRLDGVGHARLASDDRVPMEHKLEEGRHSDSMNRAFLATVERASSEDERRAAVEEAEPVLTAGGMRWDEIYELAKLYNDYAESSLKSPRAIANDSSVNAGMHFITTGVKPASRKKGQYRILKSKTGRSTPG